MNEKQFDELKNSLTKLAREISFIGLMLLIICVLSYCNTLKSPNSAIERGSESVAAAIRQNQPVCTCSCQ